MTTKRTQPLSEETTAKIDAALQALSEQPEPTTADLMAALKARRDARADEVLRETGAEIDAALERASLALAPFKLVVRLYSKAVLSDDGRIITTPPSVVAIEQP